MGGNTGCAGGIHQIDVALHGLGRGVELQHHGGIRRRGGGLPRGEGLTYSLRPFDEEASLALAKCAFGEPPNPFDPG